MQFKGELFVSNIFFSQRTQQIKTPRWYIAYGLLFRSLIPSHTHTCLNHLSSGGFILYWWHHGCVVPLRHWRAEEGGRHTVQLAETSHTTAHQNSFPFCIPAILNRASLSQFPLKNDHPLPPFLSPSLKCRAVGIDLSPGREGQIGC